MPRPRRTLAAALGAALLAVYAGGCGASLRVGRQAAGNDPLAALIAQARVDTLAVVAQRVYYQEAFGAPNSHAFNLVGALPGLLAGLATGDLALAARTVNQVTADHVVHQRVVRHGRTLIDVGLGFVIAGQRHPLHAPDGRYLGRIEVSIQDVIGFIKLVHRFTGAQVVVRGRPGHAKSSLAAARRADLPPTGPLTLGGHSYFVASFSRTGFAGEPLHIWILDRAG